MKKPNSKKILLRIFRDYFKQEAAIMQKQDNSLKDFWNSSNAFLLTITQ